MLHQKRPQRRKFVASSESAAVASDTTLGLIVTNSIGLATNRQDHQSFLSGRFQRPVVCRRRCSLACMILLMSGPVSRPFLGIRTMRSTPHSRRSRGAMAAALAQSSDRLPRRNANTSRISKRLLATATRKSMQDGTLSGLGEPAGVPNTSKAGSASMTSAINLSS